MPLFNLAPCLASVQTPAERTTFCRDGATPRLERGRPSPTSSATSLTLSTSLHNCFALYSCPGLVQSWAEVCLSRHARTYRCAQGRFLMRTVLAVLLVVFSGQLLAQGYTSSVIPYVVQTSDQQTVLTITSTGVSAGSLSITVFDSGGTPVGKASVPLAKGGRISGSISDLLALPQGFNVVGWAQLTSDVPFAATAEIDNLNDGSASVVPLVQSADTVQYLPQVDLTSGHGDLLLIVNANAVACSSEAVLYDASGSLLGTSSLSIPAQGMGSLDIAGAFGVTGLAGGHVEVVGSLPIIVLERMQGGSQSSFIRGQSLLQGQGLGDWRLGGPPFATSTNHQQAIVLANPSATPDPVTVKVYNSDGTQSSVSTIVLDPKAQQTLDVSTVLNGQNGGYAVLTAATPPVAITLGGAGQNQWSLQSVSSIQGDHFLPTASLGGLAPRRLPSLLTGVESLIGRRPPERPPVQRNGANLSFMLVNLSSASNQFTIETRTVDGSVTGQSTVTIPPGQALTTTLQKLVQHSSETNTSIRISSAEESAIFGLYGVLNGVIPVAADVPADAESRLIPTLLLQSADRK